MQLGMVGLGRMGHNMAERLRAEGHDVVGYDANPEISQVADIAGLVARLEAPRTVWVMVPAGLPTQAAIQELAQHLAAGDLVIDGGNSNFADDAVNAAVLAEHGVGYLDCGVSGGVWGRENGYGIMVGGAADDVDRVMPIFDTLRPAGPREEGFVHAGGIGAGHYAKMVHNAIEYGLMQAYAEGWELLRASNVVTSPEGCFKAWTRGTVVRSWLLDLLVDAVEELPGLDGIDSFTTDSGEGRWALEEAIRKAVPMPVLATSLFARFASRQPNSPTMQMVSALRGQFGGHAVIRTPSN